MLFSEPTKVIDSIIRMAPGPGEAIAIFAGEKSGLDISCLISRLNEKGISFFGGLFPSVVYGDTKSEKGIVVKKMPGCQGLFAIRDIASHLALSANSGYKSAVILVDGVASGISKFLSNLFKIFGDKTTYLGGGAGFSDLNFRECLFSNEGFFKGGALLAFFDRKVSLAVKHGWERFSGPHVVTRSAGNVVMEINWENAFGYYQAILKNYCDEDITPENFFEAAKKYPFGLYKKGSEDIVRDAIKTDGSNLVCVGEVPENALIYFMKGSKDALINSARQVAETSLSGGLTPTDCLVFDCISRVLYLEDSFEEELKAINNALPLTVEGALTLGEISSYGHGGVTFLNKTVVVGVVYER